MSDLISRADAIEAVCRTRCGDKTKGCPAHSCLVIEEFDAIPSAELPKGDLISRADVLKYPIRLDHYDEVNGNRVFVYGVESVIEYVESLPSADAVQGWIPLSHDDDGMGTDFPYERDGEWVIVTDGKTISVERIKKDAYDHFFPNGRWFELEDVVAWMPLPTPHKGGDSE